MRPGSGAVGTPGGMSWIEILIPTVGLPSRYFIFLSRDVLLHQAQLPDVCV